MNLASHWYRSRLTALTFLLLPLSWIFNFVVSLRQFLYCLQVKKTHRFSVPVIVVGNITVGGTGKTPLVIWLANLLRAQGFKPGIVTRGVGGQQQQAPRLVRSDSCVREVGDEAVLLAARSGCPVMIGINRVAAVKALLQQAQCDVVISDDGLQHYALHRDIEIAVIDGMRGLGNQRLLPAGPLREKPSRLKRVDFVVRQGSETVSANEVSMQLQGNNLVALQGGQQKAMSDFKNQRVHAVAAIGNPKRFFECLRTQQLDVIEHVFPDHYLFQAKDICFADNLPVIMTEKDAVKCREFASSQHWYYPVDVVLSKDLGSDILKKIHGGVK